MDDAAFVGVLDRLGQGLSELGGRPRGKGSANQSASQAAPVHVFQGEIGVAVVTTDLMDLDDIGMLEAGDGLGFGAEAAEGLGAGVLAGEDHFQGHQPVERDLAGLVNHSHAAAAQNTQDFVAGHSWRLGKLGFRRPVRLRPIRSRDKRSGHDLMRRGVKRRGHAGVWNVATFAWWRRAL
jgi:hypothetical protein